MCVSIRRLLAVAWLLSLAVFGLSFVVCCPLFIVDACCARLCTNCCCLLLNRVCNALLIGVILLVGCCVLFVGCWFVGCKLLCDMYCPASVVVCCLMFVVVRCRPVLFVVVCCRFVCLLLCVGCCVLCPFVLFRRCCLMFDVCC